MAKKLTLIAAKKELRSIELKMGTLAKSIYHLQQDSYSDTRSKQSALKAQYTKLYNRLKYLEDSYPQLKR